MNDLFDDNPFGLPALEEETQAAAPNAPAEMTVSEISQKLKRTVESTFSFVRVRGEISRVTVAKSGHMYTALKDEKAVLDAVCWRGTVNTLNIKPEEGMDVIVTGRLTTYPGRSNYQIVIETMELAGQGALLKMLEERRKKLAAEGLFDESRKKSIPFLPKVIGVITSPTGAVIRDILHRLRDRFPRPVYLWPVMVQGESAAASIVKAIEGFNALPEGSLYKPDVLIVARGGGSLEDLIPFNDEALVRAVAACDIPVISAVGHETDTTLIDYAADLRAPTPTAAAEKAVPVRADLLAHISQTQTRLTQAMQRMLRQHDIHLQGLARGLSDPRRLLETAMQNVDHLALRLENSLTNGLNNRSAKLRELGAHLSPHVLNRRIVDMYSLLDSRRQRLRRAGDMAMKEKEKHLLHTGAMLESLSFKRVLERGYAVVFDAEKNIVSSAQQAKGDMSVRFKDGEKQISFKD